MPKWVEEYNMIQAIRSGDKLQYVELIKRYQRCIFNLFCSITNSQSASEELTSQLFATAYTQLKKFRFDISFYLWIYRIALEMGLSYMDRQGWEAVPEDALYNPPAPEDGTTELTPEDQVHSNPEFRRPLRRAFGQLSRKQRRVMVLKYQADCTYEQIYEITGLPEPKSKTIVYRARMSMRKKLLQWQYLK